MEPTRARSWPIAFPYPHFMGFAPLDVWWRLLFRPRVAVPPRFWPRLAVALSISLIFTILSLPERVITGLWLRFGRSRKPLPGPVIILGYYRSGTTLLQFLLSRDPHLYSPDWAQAFAPQGYWLTWTVLRWVFLPFFPRSRPQDNVAFGPLVPAEDDFALNAWALASTVPGRLVVPQAHGFYDRFHDLEALTPAERERWQRYQLAFVRKLAPLAGQRRVLLKTPAHTARIAALLELFKDSDVKFVYISRHPHKVFRSNVSMLQRLSEICGLQPPLAVEDLEDYLCREYVASEEKYQQTRSLIPGGSLAEVRLQDLQADPLGTLRRIYRQLGLAYSPAFEQRVIAYLHAHRGFQPNVHPPWTARQQERILPALEPLVRYGRHDEPAAPKFELPAPDLAARRGQAWGRAGRTLGFGLISAVLLVGAWLGLIGLVGEHSLGFVWPCGMAIGVSVLRGSGNNGSRALGLWAMLLTALALLAVLAVAFVLFPDAAEKMLFYLILACFWWILGLASAYRIATQSF